MSDTLYTATNKQFDLLTEQYRYTKKDDRLPVLQLSLRRSERNPIDFASISSVNFSMIDYYDNTASAKVDHQPCIVTSSINATIQYHWQSGDTDTVGAYIAEIQVLYENGKEETFPKSGRLVLLIEEDI